MFRGAVDIVVDHDLKGQKFDAGLPHSTQQQL